MTQIAQIKMKPETRDQKLETTNHCHAILRYFPNLSESYSGTFSLLRFEAATN